MADVPVCRCVWRGEERREIKGRDVWLHKTFLRPGNNGFMLACATRCGVCVACVMLHEATYECRRCDAVVAKEVHGHGHIEDLPNLNSDLK